MSAGPQPIERLDPRQRGYKKGGELGSPMHCD